MSTIHDLAYRAHQHTSMVPEKRAVQVVKEYNAQIQHWRNMAAVAPKENKVDLERFLERWTAKYKQYLERRSRCMSILVCGPARFPVRRNEKANNAADNTFEELQAMEEKFKIQCTKKATISIYDDNEAVAKLERKLEELQRLQDHGKAQNKLWRKALRLYKKNGTPIHETMGSPWTAETVTRLQSPDTWWNTPHPPFEFSNRNANIKRVKLQIEKAKAISEHVDKENEEHELSYCDGVLEVSHDADRTRFYFPDKESALKVKHILKRYGFRWSGKNKCWQCYPNPTKVKWTLEAIKEVKS